MNFHTTQNLKNTLQLCLTLVFCTGSMLMGTPAVAQLEGLGDMIKDKAKQRVQQRLEEGVDKGLDKAEEGLKKGGTRKNDSGTADQDKGQEPGSQTQQNGQNAGAPIQTPNTLKAFSKYDYIPGAKVLAADDFIGDAVGDYPAKWNTDASGEVVTLRGKTGKWLMLNNGKHLPEYVSNMPENFTLEFDLHYDLTNAYWLDYLYLVLSNPEGKDVFGDGDAKFSAGIYNHLSGIVVSAYNAAGTKIDNDLKTGFAPQLAASDAPMHIALWRQKNRLRLYMNEKKVLDLPRALPAGTLPVFRIETSGSTEAKWYLGNVRYAIGAPDLRNKLLAEGRVSTTGILFDAGKDKVLPASYGTLKEIGALLQENSTLKLKVIGHTDADGAAAANLDLSKRRAAAVKQALVTEFGIDGSRLTTDGKGSTAPAMPNTDAASKAMNRRVEFVKEGL